MIVYRLINDKYCPQIACDVCGAYITECKLAAVVHRHIDSDFDIEKAYYCHKGACLDTLEAKLGSIGWHEMSTHFLHLMRNINLKGLVKESEYEYLL